MAKEASPPYASGGGGVVFETKVQAYFALLLLTEGTAPCLPSWPIQRLQTQARRVGFQTDDLIVFAQNPTNPDQSAKLLTQIKHAPRLTKTDSNFEEVLAAAWADYNNTKIFDQRYDRIALVTGPLSKTDLDLREILDWSRTRSDASTFLRDVGMANFSSENKRDKLEAIRHHLKNANGGALLDSELFEFLRRFFVLPFDLDSQHGANHALIHTLIGRLGESGAGATWALLVTEVQSINQSGGEISTSTFSSELLAQFARLSVAIPEELEREFPEPSVDWRQTQAVLDVVHAMIVGSWKEANSDDLRVVASVFGEAYEDVRPRLQQIAASEGAPIEFKNGVWSVKERLKLWPELAVRVYPDHLDRLRNACVEVLSEVDPKFELDREERPYASLREQVPSFSLQIRRGLSQSLALVGSFPDELSHCDLNQVAALPVLTLRGSFHLAKWQFWATIDDQAPVLAEGAPKEFLSLVNEALDLDPSPFIEVFAQEGTDIFDTTHTSGLLWALERLAWKEDLLVQTVLTLGRLASIDPGGQYLNRPRNSLIELFLPWIRNIPASLEAKTNAIKALTNSNPDIAFEVLTKLLPNQVRSSSGTNRPEFRSWVPADYDKNTTQRLYRDGVEQYSGMLVDIVESDHTKLVAVIRYIDDFPPDQFHRLDGILRRDLPISQEDRATVWEELQRLIIHHRSYPEAQWSLPHELLDSLEETAQLYELGDPRYKYRRLFVSDSMSLFTDREFETHDERLLEMQKAAIGELLQVLSVRDLHVFAVGTQRPWVVGAVAAMVGNLDEELAELGATSQDLDQFILGYWNQRFRDDERILRFLVERTPEPRFVELLSRFPFEETVWLFAEEKLENSGKAYWRNVVVDFPRAENLAYAVGRLMENGRPLAAVECIYQLVVLRKERVDPADVTRALLDVPSSGEEYIGFREHHLSEVLKWLQKSEDAADDSVARVEWCYLPLLERDEEVPSRLANQIDAKPAFFHELVSTVYRSETEGDPGQEKQVSWFGRLLQSVKRRFAKPSGGEVVPTPDVNARIAENAYRLLNHLKQVPGLRNGELDAEYLVGWIREVQRLSSESGHEAVANIHLGGLLLHTPADETLWVNSAIAAELDRKENEDMRRGYSTAVYNARGVHWVDPMGSPELELSKEFNQKAEAVELIGLRRFGQTLRSIADDYQQQGDQIRRGEGPFGDR